MNGFQRRAAVLTTIAGLAFLSLAGVASAGNDHGQGEHHPVTICHRTDSNTNPYVVITPDDDGVLHGHEGHNGPVWNPTLKAQHIKWGDIIPPTDNDHDKAITPKNWTQEGQAIWNNGCRVTTPSTTSTSTLPPTTTTTVGQTTSSLPTTTTVTSPTTVPVCQEECPVTTTSTLPVTSTTAGSTSTTLSARGTTTLPSGSPKPTVPTPPASTPTGNLAFTGSDSLILLLGAFLALCAGVGLVLLGGPKHRPGGPGDEAY